MAVEVAFNAEDKKFMDFSNTPGRHYTAKAKPEVEVRRCAMTKVQLLRENSKSKLTLWASTRFSLLSFEGNPTSGFRKLSWLCHLASD